MTAEQIATIATYVAHWLGVNAVLAAGFVCWWIVDTVDQERRRRQAEPKPIEPKIVVITCGGAKREIKVAGGDR